MAIETFDNRNASVGFEQMFIYANDITGGLFMGMVLFAFFVIVTMASYFSQERLRGKGDFLGAFAIGGLLTSTLAIILSWIPNMISMTYVIITIAIYVVGLILLFVTTKNN